MWEITITAETQTPLRGPGATLLAQMGRSRDNPVQLTHATVGKHCIHTVWMVRLAFAPRDWTFVEKQPEWRLQKSDLANMNVHIQMNDKATLEWLCEILQTSSLDAGGNYVLLSVKLSLF